MRFRRRTQVRSNIEMTPLIDGVLQLLIFFMLTSSFVTQRGIDVNLPKTVSAEKDLPSEIEIAIRADGTIFLQGKMVSISDLGSKLQMVIKASRNNLAIIKADKSVTHGLVVQVMDIAKQAGVGRIAIATELDKSVRGRDTRTGR
ncbi:MAG: ExbD/TolR family protein [bacterium]